MTILRHNGLKVYEALGLKSLLMMAARRRVDAVPLGINEAHGLVAHSPKHNQLLMIEKQLLIRYPFARLFFVNRNNQTLHSLVSRGLQKAFDNGDFMRLFRQYPDHQYYFNSRAATERRVIRLDNPFITQQVKNIPSRYFLP